jgi:hypothetical protein
MKTIVTPWRLASLLLLALLARPLAAAEPAGDLPLWFEEHRVQAHFENGIQEDLEGLYKELHPAIRSMGAQVLTRIFKTTAEGAWWPTAAGYTHESLDGRDLGREIARDAHEHGLKTIAYYRIMCDDFVENEHPQWLCRDAAGNLVLEPRTRRRRNEQDRKHVICFNSPARELVKTRLLELADRGVDCIYFDSWHMPEVCTCENCQAAYRRETGTPMNAAARRGSEEYGLMADFVARSIVRNFIDWKQAVKKEHPDVIFAIGSSLYPCFDRQMQITASLLQISDTSKTEFSKPFGGFLGWPMADSEIEAMRRRRPYLDASFALPSYDLQNALGWSLTRDSCDGRPPLMWIPFTRTEQEAIFSTAAAVSYGCIASIHPTGLWTRRSTSIRTPVPQIYKSSYALGDRVSPQLASARPHRYALIHVSQKARNARIADPRALWVEFFAPVLGVFETLKEEHLPVATINDVQLASGIPPETRVVILPHAQEVMDTARAVLREFESAGGTVLRLDTNGGWHSKRQKPRLKQELSARLAAVTGPPIRVRGPAAMHAVFFQQPATQKTVVCLVNDFGWFRSEREVSDLRGSQKAPPPCTGVMLEIPNSQPPVRRVLEAVTGEELVVRRENGKSTIMVPDFPIMACVVVQWGGRGD